MGDIYKNKSKEQLIIELRELKNQYENITNSEIDILDKERINFAIEFGNEGFWEFNIENKSLFLSKSHYDFLGYNLSEKKLDYNSWLNLIHPEDIEKVKAQITNVIDKKSNNWLFEYRIKLKSGNYKWLFAKGKVEKWNSEGYPVNIIGIHTDISQRKSVEESLRKSEKFFASAFENAGIGIAILNTKFQLLRMNKAFCDMSKYSEDELKNMSYLNLIPLKDIVAVKKIIKKLLLGEIPKYQTERSYIKKDGSIIWVNVTATVVCDNKHNPEFVIGMGEDITAKKQTEKIQTAIYNITNAINTTNDLFELISFIRNNILNIIDIKNFYIALYDKSKDVFIFPNLNGKTSKKYYSFPADKYFSSHILNNKNILILNDDDIKNYVSRRLLKIVGEVPKQLISVPLLADNDIVGVIGIQLKESLEGFTDINNEILKFISNQVGLLIQKKQSEDALKIERAHFKELFDSSPEAVALMDNRNIIININKEFSNLFGYTREEAIGNSIDKLIVHENKKEEASLCGEKVINGKYIEKDTVRKKKDNSLVDVLVFGAPIKVDNGQIGIYAIYQDISKRKKTEKNLREAKEKAEESDILKTSFLTNMSHEIRTPMNAILGFSELMLDEYLSVDERREFVKEISNNSKSLLKLIENIIDISKIESNQIVLRKEEINLNRFLVDIYVKFNDEKAVFGKENISLRISKKNNINNAFVNSDGLRLKQIFNHLISNSLKYTEKGSIEFGYTINENGFPEFFVKDSGIGIRKDKQEIIFEHFRKIEDDNTRLYRGTGIGLTITKKLVTLLGGNIWVKSEVNKGSAFYFTIAEEVSVRQLDSKAEKFKLKKEIYNWENVNILIAEDENSNIKVLEAMLSKTKAKISVVKNGQDAVDYCKNNVVDIVLMDLKMPVLNGIEATRKIKLSYPQIKVIIQTAYFYDKEKQDCINAGSSDFIYKPVSVSDLLQTIAKYI